METNTQTSIAEPVAAMVVESGPWLGGLGNEDTPAPNSCMMCKHEMTCGYSGTDDKTGKRDPGWAYRPCILGLMSSGETFFKPKISSPNKTDQQ